MIEPALALDIGHKVRIERDETRYPSKGTWPQFRGRSGTLVQISLGEYGVCFGKVWPRADRPGVLRWSGDEIITWFQANELTRTRGGGVQRDAERGYCMREGKETGDPFNDAQISGAA